MDTADVDRLRRSQQSLRMQIEQTTRAIELADTAESAKRQYTELAQLRKSLQQVDGQLSAAEPGSTSVVLETRPITSSTRSAATLVSVKLTRILMHVPTSICHLLDADRFALIRYELHNTGSSTERLRVRCWVEGYSAEAVRTVDLLPRSSTEAGLLPTFYPHTLRGVNELTLATMHVVVEDLSTTSTFRHESYPIWLLARNSAPIDLQLGGTDRPQKLDMRDYLAAFITPHDRKLVTFLRRVVECHPKKALRGYQDLADSQARAIFNTLKEELNLVYVNSFIDFNPDDNSRTQRVRLPRETLAERQANCIDGALLFASLLEAISLRPALLTLPGHAIVAWKTADTSDDGGDWCCLDTIRMPNCDFDVALQFGESAYLGQQADPEFKLLDIAALRRRGITPLT